VKTNKACGVLNDWFINAMNNAKFSLEAMKIIEYVARAQYLGGCA
jgi:hypothetical protein